MFPHKLPCFELCVINILSLVFFLSVNVFPHKSLSELCVIDVLGLGVPPVTKSAVFLNIVQKGGGVISMFKNFGANFV